MYLQAVINAKRSFQPLHSAQFIPSKWRLMGVAAKDYFGRAVANGTQCIAVFSLLGCAVAFLHCTVRTYTLLATPNEALVSRPPYVAHGTRAGGVYYYVLRLNLINLRCISLTLDLLELSAKAQRQDGTHLTVNMFHGSSVLLTSVT